MNTTLLLKLAEKLRTVPYERFDMRRWVGDDWTGDPTLSCGTSACAMGWATTVPEIRKAGLRLVGPRAKRPLHYDWLTIAYYDRGKRRVVFHSETWKIARKVFGLNAAQTQALFMPRGDAPESPFAKAVQIEALVRKVRRARKGTR